MDQIQRNGTSVTHTQRHLNLKDAAKQQKVENLLRPLDVSDDVMHRVMSQFEQEIGLAVDKSETVQATSSLGMKPAYIPELINGQENGQYLALDVGGTNFRVLLVTIQNGKKVDSIVEFFDVPEALLTQSGEKLFEFFAQCTLDFIRKHLPADGQNAAKPISLGFCFSLPMDHTSARNATLLHWTKRFRCPNTEGRDVTEMLQVELDKLHANVHVLVNVNDTVGTLMAGSVIDRNVRVGLILGSGSNTAFLERADRVPKYFDPATAFHKTNEEAEMIIIEIDNGAFGDNGSIDFAKTIWDKRVDDESNHPGSYTFEKLIGGAFQGEIIRHVLLSLIEDQLLFSDATKNKAEVFRSADSVHTSVISETLRNYNDNEYLKSFLYSAGLVDDNDVTEDDRELVKYVCWLVSDRTAKFVACAQAQVLRHMEPDLPKTTKDSCTAIAVTGGLFEKHPTLQQQTVEHMQRLVPKQCRFRFVVVKDGSGEGAAFCAAVANRLNLH